MSGGGGTGRRRLLRASQRDVLEQWLRDSVSHPYPTEAEKVTLAAAAGLEVRETWPN